MELDEEVMGIDDHRAAQRIGIKSRVLAALAYNAGVEIEQEERASAQMTARGGLR